MNHNYLKNAHQNTSNMPLTEIWCLVIFSLRHGHKESVLNLEAAGPKPVLVCVRLLLCESHWKKVLGWKDLTGKACNTAGSNNGVDISRWGAGVKISRILKSRIPFTFTGNLAHDYLSSFSQRRNDEKCVKAQMIKKVTRNR